MVKAKVPQDEIQYFKPGQDRFFVLLFLPFPFFFHPTPPPQFFLPYFLPLLFFSFLFLHSS